MNSSAIKLRIIPEHIPPLDASIGQGYLGLARSYHGISQEDLHLPAFDKKIASLGDTI